MTASKIPVPDPATPEADAADSPGAQRYAAPALEKGWTSWRRWRPARPATRWPSWRRRSAAASARSSAWR
ncbi:hypothetical protein WJ969_12415 [Achromobacter xylosoxidans]